MHLILIWLGVATLIVGFFTLAIDAMAILWAGSHLIPTLFHGLSGIIIGLVLVALGRILGRLGKMRPS